MEETPHILSIIGIKMVEGISLIYDKVVTVLFAVAAGLFSYLHRRQVKRIDIIEEKLNNKADLDQIREIILDKLLPLNVELKNIMMDVKEIKDNVEYLRKKNEK